MAWSAASLSARVASASARLASRALRASVVTSALMVEIVRRPTAGAGPHLNRRTPKDLGRLVPETLHSRSPGRRLPRDEGGAGLDDDAKGDSSGAGSGRGCSRVSTSTTPDHRPGSSGPGPPRCSTHRPPWTASGRSGRSVTARQPAPSSWPSTRGDGSTTHRESTRCAREPASASRSSTSRPRACGSNPPLSRRLRVLGPTTRRWRCSVTSCSNGVPPPGGAGEALPLRRRAGERASTRAPTVSGAERRSARGP